ncbi:MAG: putative transporter [Bacteroidales bacterium]|nr:putative transporter [Bacteroidales bacterium]MCQ2282685.1 putative transporter [Bacteroidales bacterium]
MKEFFYNLLFTPSIAQSLFLLMLTMAVGVFLAEKAKIGKFSLGVTWILFVGIVLSHFGMRLDPNVEHFAKDFGLVLFVYSIGLQVGPSFFSSFGKGGIKLNLLATCIVLLGVTTAFVIHLVTGEDMATMVGILSGAVTNTPGLGAAQQAFADMHGSANDTIATGYAVAYPLGVVGILLSIMLIKSIMHINMKKEEAVVKNDVSEDNKPICVDVEMTNASLDQTPLYEIQKVLGISMVISRITGLDGKEIVAEGGHKISLGEKLRILTDKEHLRTISLMGPVVEAPKEEKKASSLVSRRIVLTKGDLNGKRIGSLSIRKNYHVNITRINRAGIDLLATPDLVLQLGDRIMVVGDEQDVAKVADIFGNELKHLDTPNLLPIFLGVVLGIILGTLPIAIPGLSQPFKLGLAGGSLIIAILIGRFGPYYHLVTFATTSANRMIREIGISMFLAAVGLGAGESFISTVVNGGYWWILYGVIITMLPLLIVGVIGRIWGKIDYFSLAGLMSGAMTDPPALAYANSLSSDNDKSAVAYATVYPLTMFLRVMTAQLIILLCC